MSFARLRAFAVSTLMLTGLVVSPQALGAEQDFESWLADLREEASARGIGAATLDAALDSVQPIPRVIELDRSQPEFTLTFTQYMERVVPDSRIQRGRRLLVENRDLLEEVARTYGVQPRFIVALWGVETDFGRITGGFPVIAALATLAHDGRRSAYFRGELLNALQILDEGHITPEDMMGSWAGAMGQPQFMPSSFLAYAQDFSGDGKKNIWEDRADVFASAANYLSSIGWDDSATWGREVSAPPDLDAALIGRDVRKTLPEWAELGVRAVDGGPLPTRPLQASLIQPPNADGRSFLVYDNFNTIMRWNTSTYFALAVGHLADAIGAR